MSEQMTVKAEGNMLVIKIPMNPNPQPSATGKTLVVASTHGNMTTPVMVDGKPIVIGLNAYIKR
jgi:hypothetical protein